MPEYAFDWVDAFATGPFQGNPCAVFHDADDIPAAQRMRLVRETRLSECAFMVRSSKADFGVRYYLAGREIPLAGHPTVATVTSLVARGLVGPDRCPFTLEVGAGVIEVSVTGPRENPRVSMTQPAPKFGPRLPAAPIAEIFGLRADQIIGEPQYVSTGAGHVITHLADRQALRDAKLDAERMHAWQDSLDLPDAHHTEPFLFTFDPQDTAADTFARLMLPPPMPPEDPFTGSATGEMAAYLWHHGLIETPGFRAAQGGDMDRPGFAEVEVLGPRDAISGVCVTGSGTVLMQGTLRLP